MICCLNIFDGFGTIGGSFEVEYTHKFDYHAPSLALVCQSCGRYWAQMVTGARHWVPIQHQCAGCGDGTFASLHLLYREFTIPDDLLIREIELWTPDARRVPPHYA